MSTRRRKKGESGAILIIFMVMLAVMVIGLTAAVQAWSKTWRRDNEEELIFRANQYVDAIIAYRREHNGQFPTTLEELAKPGPRRLRYIRHLYKDPIVPEGRWGLLYLMPGGQGVYDPKAAQKAQEKAANEWGSGWNTAGSQVQPQGQQAGVTPLNQNMLGSGIPGTEGMPAGSQPPVAIQGNMPPVPSLPEGGYPEGEEHVSEPSIGWPIVGVISRAGGKIAEDTFKIYKGHDKVDEWQFHVFDRGERMQAPPGTAQKPAPMGVGPGIGGHPLTGSVGGGDLDRRGPTPGRGNRIPGQGQPIPQNQTDQPNQ